MRNNPFDNKAEIEPVRPVTMTEQSRRLVEHLQEGGTINFVQAHGLGITHLSQRIAELRAHDVHIYQRQIRMYNTPCFEYRLFPFPDQQPELEDLDDIKPAARRRLVK